jgi:hypothetical protein
MLPRRSEKFTSGGILNMLAMISQPDKLKHGPGQQRLRKN